MIWFKQNTWELVRVVFNLVLALLPIASFYHMYHLGTRWLGGWYSAETASHTFSYHNSYHPSMMVLKPGRVDPLPLQLPSARDGLARSFSTFIIHSFLHIHIRMHVPPHRTEDRGENLIFVTDTSQWERGTQKSTCQLWSSWQEK